MCEKNCGLCRRGWTPVVFRKPELFEKVIITNKETYSEDFMVEQGVFLTEKLGMGKVTHWKKIALS